MNEQKTVFLINPPHNINRMCAELLPEENFQSSLTIVSEGVKFVMRGWEMSLGQLRCVHQNALASGYTDEIRVASYRRGGVSIRFLKKEEWITSAQHKRSLARRITRATTQKIKNFLM